MRRGVWLGLLAALLAGCGGAPQANGGGQAPKVVIASLNPPLVFAGAGATQITVATDTIIYPSGNIVLWDGQAVTTGGNTGWLTAAIPAADLAVPGVHQISIQSGDVVSSSAPFYILPAAQANAGVVQLISANLQGQPSDGGSSTYVAISATGRYVAFQSDGNDLVAGPQSGYADIYERDTCIGAPAGCAPATIRVSVSTSGGLANGHSYDPSISADGRYVAFDSNATNLVPGIPPPSPAVHTVYLRDTCVGAPAGCAPSTSLISADSAGGWVAGGQPSLAQSARFVAWQSPASLFGGGGQPQIADRDTCVGAAGSCVPGSVLASATGGGAEADQGGSYDSISPDGRFVAFQSWSRNLVAGVDDGFAHVYLRDTCLGAPSGCVPQTTIMDATPGGVPANYGTSDLDPPGISAGGRYVAFDTDNRTTNLAPNPNQIGDLFVRDTCNGAPPGCTPSVTVVSIPVTGTQANSGSDHASITPDGRYIAYSSLADNLVFDDPGPLNSNKDIFVRDTCSGAPVPCTPVTLWASVAQMPGDPYVPSYADCEHPALSADGHYVVFIANSQDLLDPFGLQYNGNVQVYLAKTGF